MRVLLTGSGGMLGPYVADSYRRAGHEVFATDLHGRHPHRPSIVSQVLDVRDRSAVEGALARARPDLVVHLAAETSLESCSQDPGHAYRTNAAGTAIVAAAATSLGARLVYVSTAGVFGAEVRESYSESDQPRPLTDYGSSKYAGEVLARSLSDRCLVVRPGWMMGGGPGVDHKFVGRVMAQLAAGADTIHAVTDQVGTPTYAPAFAERLVALTDLADTGTVHLVCEGLATRFEVAERLVALHGRPGVEVIPVDSGHFAREFSVPRPASEALTSTRSIELGVRLMPSWQDALAHYLREWPAGR